MKICQINTKHSVRQKDGYCNDCKSYTGWTEVEQLNKESVRILEDDNIRFNLDILNGELI